MPGIGGSQILNTVSVCRTFRLDGLQEVLRKTNPQIKPVSLIWQVGELSAQDYVDTSVANFLVKKKAPDEVFPHLGKSDIQDLHKGWRDWYRDEFRRYWKVDDLAELLFHEAASFDSAVTPAPSLLAYLKQQTETYLWQYYDAMNQRHGLSLETSADLKNTLALTTAFEELAYALRSRGKHKEAQDVTGYVRNLRHYVEDLNRFKEDKVLADNLPEQDYTDFITFLHDLSA